MSGLKVIPQHKVNELIKFKPDDTFREQFSRLLLMYAKKFKMVSHVELGAEQSIAKAGVVFVLSVIGAAKQKGINVENIRFFKQAAELLREQSDLDNIYSWLAKDPLRMVAVDESGQKKVFQYLWEIHYLAIQDINSWESFKKQVTDHFAWFKFLDYIGKTFSRQERVQIYKSSRAQTSVVGRQGIFFSFLISMTNEIAFKAFDLKDILKFVNSLQNFREWKDLIIDKVSRLIDEREMAENILAHDVMSGIIAQLEQPENRSVYYIAGKVSLNKRSKSTYKKIHEILRYASTKIGDERYSQIYEEPISTSEEKAKAINSFNNSLEKIRPENLPHIISNQPMYHMWLDESLSFRVLYCASGSQRVKLGEWMSLFNGVEKLSTWKSFLQETVSTDKVLRILAGLEKPEFQFDHLIASFSESGTGSWEISRSNASALETERKRIKNSFQVTLSNFSLHEISQFLYSLKNDYGIEVDVDHFPEGLLLAVHAHCGERGLPDYLRNYLCNQFWYPFVSDPGARAQMDILANKRVHHRIAKERIKGESTLRDVNKARQEEYERIKPLTMGFSIRPF